MGTQWLESNIVAVAILIACGVLVLQRFTSDQWKRRLGAFRVTLNQPVAYRVLFLLIALGLLLIATLPEAAFVLPAIDAVGLDIVTILAALELRHYITSGARMLGISAGAAPWLRARSQRAIRCINTLRATPALWLYAGPWMLIWHHTLMGRFKAPPPI